VSYPPRCTTVHWAPGVPALLTGATPKSTAAVAIDGADSKGKANDNEVRGDAAAVAQRRGAEAAAAAI